MLAALTASCRDSVLAVRIPAAAALASLCSTLGHTVAAASGAGQCGGPEADAEAHAAATAAGRAVLPACLRLAASAAGDSDKLRPSGLQAIGSLFQLHTQLAALEGKGGAAALPAASEVAPLLAAAAQAVQQCLASGSARVQWAACEAAGALLACPPPQAQPRWAALLPQLAALLQSGRNFRSRALAAAALRQLDGSAALPAGSLLGLLEQVAAVLFEGAPTRRPRLWPETYEPGLFLSKQRFVLLACAASRPARCPPARQQHAAKGGRCLHKARSTPSALAPTLQARPTALRRRQPRMKPSRSGIGSRSPRTWAPRRSWRLPLWPRCCTCWPCCHTRRQA